MPTNKSNLSTLTHEELTDILAALGEPAFRAKQIFEWIHVKHANSFDEMTNLSKDLRLQLKENYTLGGASLVTSQKSVDGSIKYLLAFNDGTSVECVGMPNGKHLTVCVSTQAGCGMGCQFCATGNSGFIRNLTSKEITSQVAYVEHDFNMRVSNVVLMGQGEPFANYNSVVDAMKEMNSEDGFGIAARRITVSTCGIIPAIHKFAREKEQFGLAVSLHSAVQTTRNALMPGVKKYSLVHLHETMQTYADETGRRPTYEYALIAGVNDTPSELNALMDFTRSTLCHVNLIQLNQVSGSRFKPSTPEKLKRFVTSLESVGVETTVRNSRGSDIDAACGQLKQRHLL